MGLRTPLYCIALSPHLCPTGPHWSVISSISLFKPWIGMLRPKRKLSTSPRDITDWWKHYIRLRNTEKLNVSNYHQAFFILINNYNVFQFGKSMVPHPKAWKHYSTSNMLKIIIISSKVFILQNDTKHKDIQKLKRTVPLIFLDLVANGLSLLLSLLLLYWHPNTWMMSVLLSAAFPCTMIRTIRPVKMASV